MGSYSSKLLIQQYWNLFCLGLWKSSFLTAQMWICKMEVARTGRCGPCPKWSPCLCYLAYSQRALDLTPVFSCFSWQYWDVIGSQRNDGDSKAGLFICYLLLTFNRVILGISIIMRLPSLAQSPVHSLRSVNDGCWNGYLQLCAGHLAVSACDAWHLPKGSHCISPDSVNWKS